jgi:hypothetical protein
MGAGRRARLERRASGRSRARRCSRPVHVAERSRSNCTHDEPQRGGRLRGRHDLQPAGIPGRFRRGDGGLLAPRRRLRTGRRDNGGRRRGLRRCYGRRSRRGLLDALRRRRGGRGPRGERDPGAFGQEGERVEIALLLGGASNPQMHVWLAGDRVGALADRADPRSFGHLLPALHGDRAELQQGHGVPVTGADRQRATSSGNGSGERHGPRGRCAHRLAERASHIDPAMLSSRVRIRAEGERSEHRPIDRPGPRLRSTRKQQRNQRARDDCEPTNRRTSFVVSGVERPNVERSSGSSRCHA